MGSRPADAALQEGRREVLRQHGLAPRQLLPVELQASPVECRQHGAETRRGGRVAEGRLQKYGLRFGVSEHLGASFTWFQSSHRADKTGPKAGVPYDGANSKYWDLYHFPADPGDTGWYSKNPKWQQQWYNEIKELVDNYHPDLLYSDGGVPFGNEVGLSMIAHLYNSNIQNRSRKASDPLSRKGAELLCDNRRKPSLAPQVIYNCKQKSEGRWVEDLERGIMPKIDPYPWQTDTSIGDWFYDRNWKFRPVSWVIHMLVDNVSKNGNLLLNIVQRPDGSLDPEVETMLEQLGRLERDPRRGHLRHAALAGLRRKRGEGQGRQLQRGLQVQRQGNPLHHQGRDALRHRARLAGGRPARGPLARQARRRGRQPHHAASACSVTKARSNGSRPPTASS